MEFHDYYSSPASIRIVNTGKKNNGVVRLTLLSSIKKPTEGSSEKVRKERFWRKDNESKSYGVKHFTNLKLQEHLVILKTQVLSDCLTICYEIVHRICTHF